MNLENSFTDTLKKSELVGITKELAEIGVDELLDDGLLKDIPVINTIFGTYKTGANIRDQLFLKKLITFLSCLSDISTEERQKMIIKLDQDEGYKNNVGEHLIVLLDRVESVKKSIWLGLAFLAFCKGNICSLQLQKICSAIERILIHDIDQLPAFSIKAKDQKFEVESEQNFLNAGLAYVQSGWGLFGIAQPNETCSLFVEYILQVKT